MTGNPIARVGDTLSHSGAVLITGSTTREVDQLAVVRLGDPVDCPAHGLNSVITVQTTTYTDNLLNAHVSAVAACGALIITGSPDLTIG